MSLTNKRRVFVEQYLRTSNASEAARQAGYAHPGSEGHRLLKNAEIQSFIKARITDVAMDADEVLERLANGIRQSTKFDANIIRALELVGKHHRLFVERHEVQADVTARLPEHLTDALSRGHDEETDSTTD